ncbi:hypothetical protein QYE76_055071 [Lolium multiflorum]|uniref:Uncharacterized protein n=1 Tax=Lolium multiflorum TaxID=4521 RepID=A0AAD8SZ51_LOLMU|nr:hypothetical protein QYE76_055071 [Lolium multiflorum]
MGKKRISTLATAAASSGAAARSSPKRNVSHAPPSAPAPSAPSSSIAGSIPGDWPASTTTKRDEKKAKSLGYIPSEEGNVILPANDISDTAGHDDDADHAAFVDAPAEETEALPSKSSLNKLQVLIRRNSSFKDLQAVISSLESFASQYASLEVDKAQLQKEVESSSSKLEGAIKIAAEARAEIDALKGELEELRRRLKDEETAKLTTEARAMEKDELLRQSSLGAADIPAEALDEVPNNSPSNTLSMTLASHQLVQDLLQKGKGAMARIHSMILPKISQDKTLGQLFDAFAVNTKEVVEVYPVPSYVDDSSGAVPESDRLQRMKDRIAQVEKDMRSTYALAAIINKKNEIVADAERYALTELFKATESLNFVALNKAEENKRIHERVNALTQLSPTKFSGGNKKASTIAKFQDRSNRCIASTSATRG